MTEGAVIYPNITFEKWHERYPLEIVTYDCPICSQQFKTVVPVVSKDYAGFESTIHGCGPGFTSVVMTARSDEAKALWVEIFDSL